MIMRSTGWLGLVAISLLLLFVACTQPTPIYDETTPLYVEELDEVPPDALVIENYVASMVRRNDEYLTPFAGEIVINSTDKELKRGDVVYIKPLEAEHPRAYFILRIIGLPGETFEVKGGQYYINDARLETFYGRVLHNGYNHEEYEQFGAAPHANAEAILEELTKDVKKMKIPDDHYFLAGDNGWRSRDSFLHGPIHESAIIGKVIGYYMGNFENPTE